jgi:hypothetical protein
VIGSRIHGISPTARAAVMVAERIFAARNVWPRGRFLVIPVRRKVGTGSAVVQLNFSWEWIATAGNKQQIAQHVLQMLEQYKA